MFNLRGFQRYQREVFVGLTIPQVKVMISSLGKLSEVGICPTVSFKDESLFWCEERIINIALHLAYSSFQNKKKEDTSSWVVCAIVPLSHLLSPFLGAIQVLSANNQRRYIDCMLGKKGWSKERREFLLSYPSSRASTGYWRIIRSFTESVHDSAMVVFLEHRGEKTVLRNKDLASCGNLGVLNSDDDFCNALTMLLHSKAEQERFLFANKPYVISPKTDKGSLMLCPDKTSINHHSLGIRLKDYAFPVEKVAVPLLFV